MVKLCPSRPLALSVKDISSSNKEIGWMSGRRIRGRISKEKGLTEIRHATRNFACASGRISESYMHPEAYDIAFGYRDFESEAAFMLQVYQEYEGSGNPIKKILDVGCGPGRHAILLSQATGCKSLCLDNSPSMLQHVADRAKEAGVIEKIDLVEIDMNSEKGYCTSQPLSALGSPSLEPINFKSVDMAMIMLGTISHCVDNSSAIQCLKNIAELVRPGGILILELAHPYELWDGTFLDGSFVHCWEVDEHGNAEFAETEKSSMDNDDDEDSGNDGNEKNENQFESEESIELDGKRVLVEYGRESDHFDTTKQVLHRTVGISLFSSDGELMYSNVDTILQRQFTLQEIDLIGRVSGWKLVSTFGDFSTDISLEHEDAYRLVAVLQRTAS